MKFDLYSAKEIVRVREIIPIRKNVLKDMFFAGSDTVSTEEVILEIQKGGEMTAPFITELEAGRPMGTHSIQSNLIKAPSIAPLYALTPRDYFERSAGMALTGAFSPAQAAGKRVAEILTEQEKAISNKEEYMVAQFLTTGKVESRTGEASYIVDYKTPNISTLTSSDQWDQTGVDPFESLRKIMDEAESASGQLVENIVMGKKAAELLLNNEFSKTMLSRDLQTTFEYRKERRYPGLKWLGYWREYNVDIYAYSRQVVDIDGKTKLDIMPENMVVGGPSAGSILYAPIINMGSGDVHMAKRYATSRIESAKIKQITTESRPILKPLDLEGYFSVTVCA